MEYTQEKVKERMEQGTGCMYLLAKKQRVADILKKEVRGAFKNADEISVVKVKSSLELVCVVYTTTRLKNVTFGPTHCQGMQNGSPSLKTEMNHFPRDGSLAQNNQVGIWRLMGGKSLDLESSHCQGKSWLLFGCKQARALTCTCTEHAMKVLTVHVQLFPQRPSTWQPFSS